MSSSTFFQGCTFAFRDQGSGEPVVFIQGVGLHGDGWLPQIIHLGRTFRTISFDNRGVGASLPLGAPLTVELMASDTLAIMDAAGVGSAHLVGHSQVVVSPSRWRSPLPTESKALRCSAHPLGEGTPPASLGKCSGSAFARVSVRAAGGDLRFCRWCSHRAIWPLTTVIR